jgi:glutaminyl-tRNA synthetase
VKDDAGRVVELRCSRAGPKDEDGRKGVGTIHWVSARRALPAEVRLYDRLFRVPDPEDVPGGGDLRENLNQASRVVMENARVEPSVADDPLDTRYQFERTGYFWRDPEDGVGDRLVFNRIVSLKDTWSRQAAADGAPPRGARSTPPRQVPTQPPQPTGPRVSEDREATREADPDLAARMERYVHELDLTLEHADVLTGSREAAEFFEAALAEHADPIGVASWMVNDLRGVLDGRSIAELPFDGSALGRLAALVDEGAVSRRAAKDVLAEMARKGGDPSDIVARLGLGKVSDESALAPVVDSVLAAWPAKVEAYRAGNENLLGLFVGEVMKATKGAADPKVVKALLSERLGGGA